MPRQRRVSGWNDSPTNDQEVARSRTHTGESSLPSPRRRSPLQRRAQRRPASSMGPSTMLVSGASGFLGSHLCYYFLVKGHRDVCVDNLDTDSRQSTAQPINGAEFSFITRI
jgi:hypothetical protein